MSDEDALLAAIAANLQEDTPRLVYADWLDEHGQAIRAEFIRVEIAVKQLADLPTAEQARKAVLVISGCMGVMPIVLIGMVECAFLSIPPSIAPAPRLVHDRAPPESWKVTELDALFSDSDQVGTITILVWEVIDYAGAISRIERCFAVKQYAKKNGTRACALGYFLRRPDDDKPVWKPWTLYLSGTKPGERDEINGVQKYKRLPTDREIVAFLKDLEWTSLTRPGEIKLGGRGSGPRRIVKVHPTLVEGGLCQTAWETVFDRAMPIELFSEFSDTTRSGK